MLELLAKKERKALARIDFKENLKKQNVKKKINSIEKAHAFIIKNLDILLETTLQNL